MGDGPRTPFSLTSGKRNIINRSYQTSADNIVGRMTIAALDKEMAQQTELGPLEITVQGDKPRLNLVPNLRRPVLRLAFGLDAGPPGVAPANQQFVTKFTRWSPGVLGTIRCAQTGGNTVAVCTNLRDSSQELPPSVKSKIAFLSNSIGPTNQAAFPAPEVWWRGGTHE